MPLNVDFEINKAASEKKTMEINEVKTIKVGDSKVTFNMVI